MRVLTGLMLAASMVAAAAQEMHGPRMSHAQVDWEAAAASLTEADAPPLAAPALLAQVNAATSAVFPKIAASPVPVLLPFDTAALLRDRAGVAADQPQKPAADYLLGFHAPPFFLTGPGGYDAAFSLYPRDVPELAIRYSERVDVHIAGSAIVYELDEPTGMIGWPVNGLEADFPGIKRLFLENYVRYSFVRFGVPYAVSIDCHDGGARFNKIACRDADKVATRFLKALRVAGGTPQVQPETLEAKTIEAKTIEANTIARPQARSTVFTYHSPGDIIAGSGFKGRGGRADYKVYSKMRFPLADAPAFANSQSFMNWGDCDQTGRVFLGRVGNAAAYRCRVNDLPLVADESAAGNFSYPWRDNFCEHRYYYVGECPGGLGHQGQDIRPSSCKQRIEGANRCEPYQHEVVAVRDGMILRAAGQQAVYLVVNAPNERIRFRYLHMLPKALDADGVLSGRAVREGEFIGKVGNYQRRERATTYHLHFDVQVPTRYGWVFVNPYMTLVAAYERLIQGRGREIGEEVAFTGSIGTEPAAGIAAVELPDIAAANPNEMRVESEPGERIDSDTGRDDTSDQAFEPPNEPAPAPDTALPDTARPVTTHAHADAGRRASVVPGITGTIASPAPLVLPVDRDVSHTGPRTRNFRGDLHTRDARHKARHRRF